MTRIEATSYFGCYYTNSFKGTGYNVMLYKLLN